MRILGVIGEKDKPVHHSFIMRRLFPGAPFA
jgi:hypothetical protein